MLFAACFLWHVFFPRFILDTSGQSFPLVPQSCRCGNLSVRCSQINPVEARKEGYREVVDEAMERTVFHRCSEFSQISCWLVAISWLLNNSKRGLPDCTQIFDHQRLAGKLNVPKICYHGLQTHILSSVDSWRSLLTWISTLPQKVKKSKRVPGSCVQFIADLLISHISRF